MIIVYGVYLYKKLKSYYYYIILNILSLNLIELLLFKSDCRLFYTLYCVILCTSTNNILYYTQYSYSYPALAVQVLTVRFKCTQYILVYAFILINVQVHTYLHTYKVHNNIHTAKCEFTCQRL